MAQSKGDDAAIKAMIRSGQIKVTDEMIEAQRKLHPELRGLSNQEVRAKLEGLKDQEQVPEPGAAEFSAPKPDSAVAPKPKNVTEGGSRFPDGLVRFGYDFFSNNPGRSTNLGNSPALPDYLLSPGDEIQIYTWGRENQNQTAIIDNEGMFHYPPLQPMRLAGMRFAEAQAMLTRELQKINGVKASVGLGKLRSIRVFVLGEAVNPGSYVVPAGATVTSALFQSGGITPIGSLRSIQLKRNGKTFATLDLYEMLLSGNNRTDHQLLPGDAIFVPVAPIQIAITGMVKRPGVYEVKPGTKVTDALALAGGLSSNAFKGRVRLDRIENHKRKVVLDIGMEKMVGNSNAAMQDGDILNVEGVLSKEFDVVYLEGNVNRPGRYEYRKGMTIKDLIPGVKDLKSETFFSYGHIKRSTQDDQGSLLLPFSLGDVLEKGTEVPLEPRDTVIVYSRYDIMDQPKVEISGEVRRPGKYSFVENMRVSDLIINGGGLTDTAYLPEAHLVRMTDRKHNDSLYSTLIKVDLSNLIDNPGDENNVKLQASDRLTIFPRNNFMPPRSVSIIGAVKTGGEFELTRNMGIPELVSKAEGLTKTSFKLKIEVVRKVVDRDSVLRREIHQLNLKDIMEGRSGFALQDGDAVYVREVVDFRKSMVVNLVGEFNFPGRYEVARGEKLSSVIQRAGGFTSSAYLDGAVFTRERVKVRQLDAVEEIGRRLEAQSINLIAQTTNEKDKANLQLAIEQRKILLEDIRKSPALGRVVIGLDQGMSFAGSDDDLVLEDGDELTVPFFPHTISIMGEVFSPTNVIFGSSNNSISECLSKAGGINEYGDANNIYYLKPDGSVITPKNTSFFGWRRVAPGGIIVVPPKGPKRDFLDALAKITQVIYQIAISVGVVKTLGI